MTDATMYQNLHGSEPQPTKPQVAEDGAGGECNFEAPESDIRLMMPDERRRVAERLRCGLVARNISEAYTALVQTAGVRPCLLPHDGESGDRFDHKAYDRALTRLADLIDPTCEAPLRRVSAEAMHDSHPGPWYRACSVCGGVVDAEGREGQA